MPSLYGVDSRVARSNGRSLLFFAFHSFPTYPRAITNQVTEEHQALFRGFTFQRGRSFMPTDEPMKSPRR